ncbi:MAG: hypothetical protein R3C13_05685 [Hyphomonas sp.]|uniref:hypothetical protein n=1 Tax=Hyphomonas sp. TaxID=87 RepID=UPI003527E2FA
MIRILALCSLVAGCAAIEESAPSHPPPMPLSTEAAVKFVDSRPACKEMLPNTRLAEAVPSADTPQIELICVPNYPSLLQRNGYQSACIADFNLAADGQPVDIRTVCRTIHDGDGSPEEFEVADAMFARLMQRATAEMRFAAPADGRGFDDGQRFLQPLKFAFEQEAQRLVYPSAQELEASK